MAIQDDLQAFSLATFWEEILARASDDQVTDSLVRHVLYTC